MVQPNSYKGKQLVLASGRVVIVGKKDAIFLNSNETISLSTNGTVNFDAGKHVIFSSPKVYLGLQSTDETQAVNRGNDVQDLLLRFINSVEQLVSVCEKSPGDIPSTLYLGLGIVKGAIAGIKETYGSDFKKILSKKIFTE